MCALCSMLAAPHWAEGRADAVLARARFLRCVLEHFDLRLDDWGDVYVVRNRAGGWGVAGNAAALWHEAARLAGGPLDPLDPGLVSRLG